MSLLTLIVLIWFCVWSLLQISSHSGFRYVAVIIGLFIVVLACGGFVLQIGHHGIVAS
jgi:hypothetical protein